MNPVETLWNGARALDAVLGPHGFEFVQTSAGSSSGGDFASGEFRRDDRRLELHLRWSLGLVRYHVGAMSLSHEELTRSVGARWATGYVPRYPGFSDDPMEAFRHLADDLQQVAQVFTAGTAEEFGVLVEWVAQNPRPTGFAAL